MNTFVIGVLVGIVLFAVIYSVFMLNKVHTGLLILHQGLDAQNKALQMTLVKINKIEKVTDSTMQAADTFVDALRESAEQMINMRPPHLRNLPEDGDQFEDLRNTFDEGIRRMEEDDDEDDNEPEEKWKKK